MHTDVHALASFRAVCVHCIASKKNAIVCIELGAHSLSNAICGPPVTMLVAELVRREDLVGGFQQGLRCDFVAVDLGNMICQLIVVNEKTRVDLESRTALPFSSTSVTWM
jgi:hypothetical protein